MASTKENVTVELLTKSFKKIKFRVHGTFENPLYCAQDVGRLLTIKNINDSLPKLDEDEKIKHRFVSELSTGKKYTREMTFVTESGLYKLIFWCNKAKQKGTQANRFLNWVVKIVIPSIRVTGAYRLTQRIAELTDRLENQNNQLVETTDAMHNIHNRYRFSAFKTTLLECGITYSPNWKSELTAEQREQFWTVWRELKNLDIVYQPQGDENSNFESRLPLAVFQNNVQLIIANL